MNDFFGIPAEAVVNNHSIWVERFRPSTLEDYIADKSFKDALQSFINKKDIPHLLFYNSSPGTGKCLDGNEYIDIQLDVSDDEYKILKKYEIIE